eukprot:TRINITY_DN1929_c0_g1_i1.p1 TRINITY_DN1929_c0_g1~~TRINITY_DN1929_c0_g1_i1.p1  ORF type:complete len:561 (-),score=89.64 TRINITY_DN1929_c0_g1_i1:102-1784(-)
MISKNKQTKEENRIMWLRLLVVYAICASDSVCLTIVTPFVPDMCRTRFGLKEEDVGLAAGFLLGAYSFSQFLSSFVIGHLSDIYGRKKLIIMGLTTACITSVFYGLAPWFYLALGLRLFAGLTNGNTSVSKACVSDLTVNADGETRAVAFAYFGGSFSLARTVASGIGGLTVGIMVLGIDNPYLLPCLIGSLFNVVTLIATIFGYPETLSKSKAGSHSKGKGVIASMVEGLKLIAADKLLLKLVAIQSINSFCNGSAILQLVLIQTLPIEYHGIGFNSLENGLGYAYFGLSSVIFQVFFFKRYVKKLGIYRTYLIGAVILGIGTFCQPFANLPYWLSGNDITVLNKALTWIILLFFTTMLGVGFMTCLPVVGTMISNAADPSRQGLTQGTSQSVASLLRASGPPLSGLLFSFSVKIKFPFLLPWFLGFGYIICICIIKTLNEDNKVRISEVRALPEKEMLVVKTNQDENENESDGANVKLKILEGSGKGGYAKLDQSENDIENEGEVNNDENDKSETNGLLTHSQDAVENDASAMIITHITDANEGGFEQDEKDDLISQS